MWVEVLSQLLQILFSYFTAFIIPVFPFKLYIYIFFLVINLFCPKNSAADLKNFTSDVSILLSCSCIQIKFSRPYRSFGMPLSYIISTIRSMAIKKNETRVCKVLYLKTLLYLRVIPFTVISFATYTPLHTTLTVLKVSPEVILWEFFKQLCPLLHTSHLTNRKFCWHIYYLPNFYFVKHDCDRYKHYL